MGDGHDDKIDEVYGAGFINARIVIIHVDIRWDFAELEPQIGERDAASLKIPKSHGERADGLYHSDDSVGLEDELPIDESCLRGMTRWAIQDICFWSLIGESHSSGTVCKATETIC